MPEGFYDSFHAFPLALDNHKPYLSILSTKNLRGCFDFSRNV